MRKATGLEFDKMVNKAAQLELKKSQLATQQSQFNTAMIRLRMECDVPPHAVLSEVYGWSRPDGEPIFEEDKAAWTKERATETHKGMPVVDLTSQTAPTNGAPAHPS